MSVAPVAYLWSLHKTVVVGHNFYTACLSTDLQNVRERNILHKTTLVTITLYRHTSVGSIYWNHFSTNDSRLILIANIGRYFSAIYWDTSSMQKLFLLLLSMRGEHFTVEAAKFFRTITLKRLFMILFIPFVCLLSFCCPDFKFLAQYLVLLLFSL